MDHEQKSLKINALYNIIYRVLNLFFPLVTTAYVSRILLPLGVGKVTFAVNIVTYFVLFAGLGIPNYGIREISKARNNQFLINKRFTELFILNSISTSVCVFVYSMFIIIYARSENDVRLNAIVSILLIFNYFNVDWLYQGLEEYRYIAIRNTIVKIVSIILLFAFVKDQNDYWKYAIIYSFAQIGNYVFNIINLRRKVKFVINDLNIKQHLKPIFILLASTVSIELYTMLDVTMLGCICDVSFVGYYNNSSKFVRTVNSLITSIGAILLPRLSYYHSNGEFKKLKNTAEMTKKVLLYLSIPAAFGVAILSKNIIIILYGKAFLPAVITLRAMSLLIIAVVFNNYYGTQILISFGLEKYLLKSVLVGALINVALNAILIPSFQHNGAAVASVISECIVWLLTLMYSKKAIHINMEIKYILQIIASAVIMSAVVFGILLCGFPIIIETILGIVIGASVYFLITLLLKNDVSIMGIKELKEFIRSVKK